MNDLRSFIADLILQGKNFISEDIEDYFGYTKVSNILILNDYLSDSELRVYLGITSYAFGGKNFSFPSQQTIGNWIGKSRQQINRIIKSLETKKLLAIIRRGKKLPNIYIKKRLPKELIENHVMKMSSQNDVKKMLHHQSDVKKIRHHNQSDVKKMLHEEFYINNNNNDDNKAIEQLKKLTNSEHEKLLESIFSKLEI
ncbi:MAG: helix-turn-helix domain-containing protein [Archaeoglobus sp.]|nr:helix-turn-helix domain-containing protein [Archaeoglobus sp.]